MNMHELLLLLLGLHWTALNVIRGQAPDSQTMLYIILATIQDGYTEYK